MRRILLSAVAASALGAIALQGATAADMPVPVLKAAPPPAAMAWYVELYGGWTKMRDYHFDLTSAGVLYTTGLSDGWVVGGAVGRQVMPWLRVELDVSHGRNRANSYAADAGGFVGTGVTGSSTLTTVTGNAWISLPLGGAMPFSPYFGGGIGGGWSRGDLTVTNGAGAQYSGNISGWAWIAGAGVRFTAWSNTELDIGYRYRSLESKGAYASSIAGVATCCGNGVHTHAIQAGLIFKF